MKTLFPFLLTRVRPSDLKRKRFVLAAGSTTQTVLTVPVVAGRSVYIDAVVQACGGVSSNATACVADASTDAITLTAHGFLTGQPVVLGGTGTPAGTTAGTVYYAIKLTANTFKVATTQANAIGATAIDLTTAGTAVTVRGIVALDFFTLKGFVSNRGGSTIKHGTATIVSYNQDAVTANLSLTASTGQVVITLDAHANLATTVEVLAAVLHTDNEPVQ